MTLARSSSLSVLPKLLLVLVLQAASYTSAFPGGAGGCAGGRAAVAGTHITRPFQTGPIGNARLQMVLDGTRVLRGAQATSFTIGEDHTLTLRLIDDAGKEFRGFLFRLGPGNGIANPSLDTTEALTNTNMDANIAFEHCVMGQGVGGLTHTHSRPKTNVTGVLRMDEPASNLALDVTVVIQNAGLVSEFYYQQFILNAVQGPPTTPPTTEAPTVMTSPPTNSPAPTASSTPPPAPGGTTAPVSTPAPNPPTSTPAPNPPTNLPQQKVAPQPKCGSLGLLNGRGGAAAQDKDCASRASGGNTRRRLKGR